MTQPLPEHRRTARDAEMFVLQDYDDTGRALDGLRHGGSGDGGGLDPALRALLVLRRAVDAQAAELVAAPPDEVTSARSRHQRRPTRWARLLPAAACAVLVVGGLVLVAGPDHGTPPTQAAATSEPVMTLLAAAEADLQTASASAPEAQSALIEHSSQLVDQARVALAALPARSRESASRQVDAVDARLAGARKAVVPSAPAAPAPIAVEAAAGLAPSGHVPGPLHGTPPSPAAAGRTPVSPGSPSSLPQPDATGFSRAPHHERPAAEPTRPSRSRHSSRRPQGHAPGHQTTHHARGR